MPFPSKTPPLEWILWVVGVLLVAALLGLSASFEEALGVRVATGLAAGAILFMTALAHYLIQQAARAVSSHDTGKDLSQLIRELVVESHTDFLTGLHNRRSFDQFFSQISHASSQRALQCAFVVIDIDRFKSINDKYGHPVGDTVLKVLSRRWHDAVRSSDLLVRLGGDEFCLVLTNVSLAEALIVAEKIRKISTDSIKADGLSADGTAVELTVSLGVFAWSTAKTLDVSQALDQADKALYQAKADGGNQVIGKSLS